MSLSKSTPRILQQQPPRGREPQEPGSGSKESQPKPGAQQSEEQQMGEGSYEATRDFQQRSKEYMKKADIEADAQAAKPRSEQEAREMEKAEEEGRSHSKGER
jgi:hypothetical protein